MAEAPAARGLVVLTNTKSPYNAQLYAELSRRVPLQVFYAHEPARAGRAWEIPTREWEHVGASWLQEPRAIRRQRRASVIISGDYTSPRSLLRITAARTAAQRCFWGERLAPGSQLKELARRSIFKGFDAVFAVGSWARSSYRQVVGPDVPVHVLPYVCAENPIHRAPNPEPVVGFAGSLSVRKGIDILLSAVSRMADPPRVELAGSGPEEARLRRLADQLGVRASWLGELSSDEINRARASWWLQAVPSRYDGWGVVVNESVASGVPVLASHMTGAAHDLLDGSNGDIVWSDAAWSAALSRWLPRACDPTVTASALRVAHLLGAPSASVWLNGVLREPGRRERDFIAEQLGRR